VGPIPGIRPGQARGNASEALSRGTTCGDSRPAGGNRTAATEKAMVSIRCQQARTEVGP
jgi:hypothetical protein